MGGSRPTGPRAARRAPERVRACPLPVQATCTTSPARALAAARREIAAARPVGEADPVDLSVEELLQRAEVEHAAKRECPPVVELELLLRAHQARLGEASGSADVLLTMTLGWPADAAERLFATLRAAVVEGLPTIAPAIDRERYILCS